MGDGEGPVLDTGSASWLRYRTGTVVEEWRTTSGKFNLIDDELPEHLYQVLTAAPRVS